MRMWFKGRSSLPGRTNRFRGGHGGQKSLAGKKKGTIMKSEPLMHEQKTDLCGGKGIGSKELVLMIRVGAS